VNGRTSHGLLLCIETSCDDTSAALVRDRDVLASIVSSQHELHAEFGGIVPEVASRRHTELLNDVVAEALATAGVGLDDLEGVAVTIGPGLIGALLVGLAAAKTFAWQRRLPLVPVDHLQGHIAANYAADGRSVATPPFLCLVVSGGHTLLARVDAGVEYRIVGRTVDDAAGEAFDKGARLLGLPYPGGRELDRLAGDGDPSSVDFPLALPGELDFSFSGLKTALLYHLRGLSDSEVASRRADIAAAYQDAIVRQLVGKVVRCAEREGMRNVAVAGGVAANSGLRRALGEACAERGLALHLPAPALCTDNAAMVGLAAACLPAIPWPEYLALDAYAAAALAERA